METMLQSIDPNIVWACAAVLAIGLILTIISKAIKGALILAIALILFIGLGVYRGDVEAGIELNGEVATLYYGDREIQVNREGIKDIEITRDNVEDYKIKINYTDGVQEFRLNPFMMKQLKGLMEKAGVAVSLVE